MSSLNLLKKVIVALDYQDMERACAHVDETSDLIDWFKIGPILFTQSGAPLIHFLHQRKKKIFVDLKLHDTPYVVSETMRQFVDLGVHYASVHCMGGHRMLEAAGKFCRNTSLQLVGIGWLTSHERRDLKIFDMEDKEEVLEDRLLTLALESRLSGLMCGPTQLGLLKSRVLPGFSLFTPGIRLANEVVYQDDQLSTATPQQALDRGADFLVIGRPVIHSREPRKVLERLFQ